ncbi:RagB/SusD family nutrient uptake outer membrane protein [Mucilaginibacter sp. ZT4R22]|uniref:RagB/SusD family nutrient uptake outer membrane protein n=1 Tax=Mucilaginibacter pankratovii TaxID=2772110 RepID=A0ABR7WWB4_9SPHI|nr:RagB/SusD family nutrient uptake outer membrane protein [Mucilaginibacter pankratovii]MBD1366578.1 RagB/SusD family nutrient uptake outer membrane protein [Mucilaginibacter pankratovii]
MKIRYIILLSAVIFSVASCKKSFLDEKSDKSLLVPTTLSDFQSMMDNIITMNSTPGLNVISADEFYTTDNGWKSWVTPMERNSYLWLSNIYEGSTTPDWDVPYQQVFYANIVLDGLEAIKPDANTQNNYNQIKGSALFYRAFAFYNLAQLFAAPYDQRNATQQPGIPIRLNSDVNIKSVRGTVQQTYDQVISDLSTAETLLNAQVTYKSRPGKAAVDALLARVYLTMGNYTQAAVNATTAIKSNNKLIDYNTLTPGASRPFPNILPNGNDEVLYYATINAYSYSYEALTYIDTDLYNLYETNDLRKTVFFRLNGTGYNFRGSYAYFFSGLATDELYLTRAECYARLNNLSGALADLNTLLSNRYVTGTLPFTTTNINAALTKILLERRKELISRGTRWTDLRRLNKEPRFATTLSRNLDGNTYTLLPNGTRYLFPIPDDEISGSGIVQNPR